MGSGGESLGDAVLTLRTNNLAFNAGLASAETRMAAFSAKARAAGMALTAGLTLPIVGLAAVATKAFVGFDKAMTGSLAIMSEVSDAMQDRMTVAARKMGRETLFSAEQAAGSYFFLASAGISAADSIEALPIVARFAQAGLFDMELATDLLTDAQSALGLVTGDTARDMENMTRISDVLAAANQTANATVQEFAESLTNEVGASLKVANKDLEEGVAVLAAFADQGVKGQVAGSQLARVMRLMGSAAVNNSEAMNELGITVFDAQGNWLNFADIIESMEGAFEGMSDAQRIAALESIGFTARVQGAILPLLGTSDKIREYEELYRNAMGTTLEISEKQLESASAKWTLFKGALDDVLIVMGGSLVPMLLSLMNAIVPVVNVMASWADSFAQLSPTIQMVVFAVFGFLAALGPVLFIAGAIAGAIGSLLPIFVGLAGVVSTIVGAFSAFGVSGGALYLALAALASPFGVVIIVLGLLAAAVALVIWKWDQFGPVIMPIVDLFVLGLTTIKDAFMELVPTLEFILNSAIKPLFNFIINNKVALIAVLTAIGVAIVIALGPVSLAVAAVIGIIVLVGLMRRHWEILRAKFFEVRDTIGKLIARFKWLGAIILVLSGPIGWFIGAAILVVKNWSTVKRAMGQIWDAIVNVTEAAGAAMKAVLDGVAVVIETTINSLIKAINAIPDIKIPGWVPGIGGRGFSIPDIGLVSIDLTPNIDFSGIDLPGLGFGAGEAIGAGLTEGMAETINPGAAMADLQEEAGVFGGDGIGSGMGEAIGLAMAEDLVPAFIRALQAEEARLGSIADIIANAISAEEVKWDDVARLWELGAVRIAEDFMDALNGEASEIGLQIDAKIADDAREAGEKAAEEFVRAFNQGLTSIESAIASALNVVGDVTGTFTREDAELELSLLKQQRQANMIIWFLENGRRGLLAQINKIQAEAAEQVSEIQRRVANNTEAVLRLRDAIETIRDRIKDIEDAAGRRIANLEGEIEVVEAWGDAQIAAVSAQIDANDTIIDGLNDQLDAKKDILKIDKETLRAHEQSLAANQKLLKDLESQLDTVQREREKAFVVLGMTPDGGAPAPTLLSSAENLQRLRDLQAQRAAPTAGFSVVDQSAGFRERTAALQAEIDDAEALFNRLAEEAAAEAERLQTEIDAKAKLVVNEQRLIDNLILKIKLTEQEIEAIEDVREAVQDQNDALREQIEIIKDAVDEQVSGIKEQIEAIEDLRDAQVKAMEDQIEWVERVIDSIERENERMEAEIDSINAVADAKVAAIEAEIAVVDDQIRMVKDHMQSLKDEIAFRAEDRRIMQLTLQLKHNLLETDEELALRVQTQIEQGAELKRILDRVRAGTADATDAFRLLGYGLTDLAALVLAIVNDPNLQIPAFAAGAVNVPRDTLAVVHAGEMIIPAQPAAAVRQALVGGQSGGSTGRGVRPVEVEQNFYVEDSSPRALQHKMRMSALSLGTELSKEVSR